MLARLILRRLLGCRCYAGFVSLVLMLLFSTRIAHAGVVTWTGSSGESWADASWSLAGGPGTADTASFTNAASVSIPGTVTSILNADRTIGGLAFSNTAGNYQTLDLGGFTLTESGNLNFNTDENSSTTTTILDGVLNVTGASSSIHVGTGVSGSANGNADLSGLTSLGATVQNLQVGTSSAGTANGALTLSPSNTINAQLIQVGASNSSSDTNGTLNLGLSNTIAAAEFDVSKNNATGNVTIVNGGSLALGSASARTLLQIGNNSINTNNLYPGTLNLADGSLNAFLSSLIVGQDTGGAAGGTSGTFAAGTGSIDIGAPGNSANFLVGNSVNSSGSATGNVNFSSLSVLNANLNAFSVGTSIGGGAVGIVQLAATNTINASNITVGSSGNGTSSLTLGHSNTILANQFTIAQNIANGNVTLPAGGSLSLGSPSSMTALTIASANNNSPNQYTGILDLSQGSFTGYLSSLTVGQEIGSNGNMIGTFNAGNSGAIVIGATGTATANIAVGNSTTTGAANGTVNFGGLSSLTANLNTFTIGTATAGSVNGGVTLAASNTINANSITVGSNGNGTNSLTFGHSNTILTSQFTIAQNIANGNVTLPAGGSLSLGSQSSMTALTIASANNNSPNQYTGVLDLSQGSFTGYLSSLTVGQEIGSNGNMIGTFNAGNSGSVVIGAAGTTTANIAVGNSTTTGAANGIVNFGGLSSLTANLNTFAIGTATAGSVNGAVTLAASNTINANSITVGSSGNGTDSLVLGHSNTILTNQLTIGQDYSTASVTIPSGGLLNLGSATAPVNLTMAVGNTNTNATYGGSLDLTNATLNAYFGNVIIGNKNALPGNEAGTLTISSNPNNYINANSIFLGGNSSTGTINYGGGVFYVGSITAGTGSANFNWTGGTLSVATFGSPTIPFNLNNTGAGTLAPGAPSGAIGTTTIDGNYTQSASATTSIRIAGDSPSTGNDQVNISQAASLAGNLNLNLINDFVPAVGENFLIETYASHTGAYSFVAPPTLPSNVAFQLDYTTTPTQLMVRMVTPVAQNYISTAAVGSFSTASSWNTNSTPGTPSSVVINDSGATAQTVTVSASTTVQSIMLSGSGSPLNFEIPQGIQLGVANELIVGNNATLSGGGHVYGNVVAAGGTVTPGIAPAILNVSGNYFAQPDSTLLLNLDGTAPSDDSTLAVSGLLTLDGTLELNLDGFTPALGDSFKILSFGSITGQFANFDLPTLQPGLEWNVSQLATTGELSVVAVPEPAALSLLIIACIGLLLCRPAIVSARSAH